MIELLLEDAEPWQVEGLCSQVGGDLWFPEDGALGNDAKRVCAQCPVRVECLEYALENNEKYGIWGGTGAHERKLILRTRRRAS